ncbi:alkaline phosphatase family protein [Actinoplanes derwentensis]|uniref:alkaline phosphatase family protein n=1 Tax=Actinoplanes derwentensis TaxID=113562 RepID=UPI001E2C9DAA|nr:alkaline phosphatase family protein [Actinoplanes derwentensis]
MPPDGLADEAFRVVTPAYGSGSLAELMPSVCAVLGVPGAVDSLGLGGRLDGVDRIGVLLVDGMGAYNLPLMKPLAPVLGDLGGGTLTTGFPSTTPVSLVTVGTGVPPSAHGVLGFTVRRPDGRVLNHVAWADDPDPRQWQPVPTTLELAAAAGVPVTVVSRGLYQGTGLSVAANRGGRYHVADDGTAVAYGMLAALRSGPGLVYGYHPDLDKAGHEDGIGSPAWADAARGVDRILDRIVHDLPSGAALLVIADHGQFNALADGRYDVTAFGPGIVGVAGEPRVRYLWTADGARDDVMAACRAVLGDDAWVLTRDEAITEGWYGPTAPAEAWSGPALGERAGSESSAFRERAGAASPAAGWGQGWMLPEHAARIGDVVIICRNRVIVAASGWEPERAGQLIAYHGSVTAAEMTVPLLIVR